MIFLITLQDQLQIPLQPLADHLESVTYEVFEKDPVKYAKYREALLAAFVDRREMIEERKVSVANFSQLFNSTAEVPTSILL